MERTWSESELAYFAGIIDGEGCFTSHLNNGGDSGSFGARLQIGNTDLLLMQWIQIRFGGSLNLERRSNPKHQSVWRWVAAAADLDHILPVLIPYLIVKKRQAELFVAYRATLNSVGRGMRARGVGRSTTKKSDEIKAERKRIHAELVALKRPHITAVSA